MICEVCYNVGNDIYSVNMIVGADFKHCRDAAEDHAKRFGYELEYVKEIPDWKVRENLDRKMPYVEV